LRKVSGGLSEGEKIIMEWINDHGYTCPLLMWIQSVIKPKQFWRYGSDGWVLMEMQTVRARSIWSHRTINLEVKFWQSKIGFKIRQWCGHQQREYRLKTEHYIEDLLEREIKPVKHDVLESNFIYQ
jgi:hypothetical protein